MGKTRKNKDIKNYYRINKKTIINKKRKMTSKLNNLTGNSNRNNQKGGFFEYFKFLLNLRKFNNIIVKFNKANQNMSKEIDSFKVQMEDFKKLAEENRKLSIDYMTNTKTRTLLEIGTRDPKIADRNKSQLEHDLNLNENNYKKINNELMQNQKHLEKEEPLFIKMEGRLRKINDKFQDLTAEYAKLAGFRADIKRLRDKYVNALDKRGKTAKKSVQKYQSHKEEYEKVLKMDDLTVQNMKKLNDEINQLQSDAGQFIDRFESIAKDRETKQSVLEEWEKNYNEIFDLIIKTISKTKDSIDKVKEILKHVDYIYSMSQVIFQDYTAPRKTNAIVEMKNTMTTVKELIVAIGDDTAKLRKDFYDQTPARLMSYTYTTEQFVTNYAIERLRKYQTEFDKIVRNIGLSRASQRGTTKGGAYDIMTGGVQPPRGPTRRTTTATPKINGDGNIDNIIQHLDDSFTYLKALLDKDTKINVIISGNAKSSPPYHNLYNKSEWDNITDKTKNSGNKIKNKLDEFVNNLIKEFPGRVKLDFIGDKFNPSCELIHVWGANIDNWNLNDNENITGGGQASYFKVQKPGVFGIITMPIDDSKATNIDDRRKYAHDCTTTSSPATTPTPATATTAPGAVVPATTPSGAVVPATTAPPAKQATPATKFDDTKLVNIYKAIDSYKGRYQQEVKQVSESVQAIHKLLNELVNPSGELEELSDDLNKITKIFIELKDLEPKIADIELKDTEKVAVKYDWLLKPVKDDYKDFEIMKSTKNIYEKIIKKDLSEDQFKAFNLDDKEALQALVLINQNVDNIVSPIHTVFQKIVSSKENLEKFLKEYGRANNKEPVDRRAGEHNCRVMNKLWSLIGADPSKADIRKLIEDEARTYYTDNSKNPHRQACNASTGPPAYNHQGQGQGKRNRGGRK